MKNERGISLIELIIFIMIMGILGTSILATFNVAGMKTPSIQNQVQALEYAQLRMDLILEQKASQGFSSFSDPCPGPATCNAPGYSVTSTISTDWNGNSNYKVIAVNVNGPGTVSSNAR